MKNKEKHPNRRL